jgi:hypothetical protein
MLSHSSGFFLPKSFYAVNEEKVSRCFYFSMIIISEGMAYNNHNIESLHSHVGESGCQACN